MKHKNADLIARNERIAKELWFGQLDRFRRVALRQLTERYSLSIDSGDLLLLNGRWYVTHSGLLGLASRRGCYGVQIQQVREFCDPSASRWVFRASVYRSPRSKGFVGYGDADPSNVSPLVRGAEMRVAETRAVNRALRKAYGIGLCSVEELGWPSMPSDPGRSNQSGSPTVGGKGHPNSQPRLRDRLCLLIRQHQLDPSLVKAYATEFCGTPTLRDASREQVEAFIHHLAEWAARDRDGLLCHLSRYAKPQEVAS